MKLKRPDPWCPMQSETMFAIVFRDGRMRGVTRPELFSTRAEAGCKLQSLQRSPAKRIARVKIVEC